MPRRIIYLKNPTQGSHFRILNGGFTNPHAPKPKKPKTPKPPKGTPDNGMGGQNGYMPGYQTPTNWFIHTPTHPAPNFNIYTGPGIDPYVQQWTPAFEEASTLFGNLYDLARGVDPYTGAQTLPYGSPGTLRTGVGSPYFDLAVEAIGRDASMRDPLVFGSSKSNPHPKLGTTTAIAPHSKEPRPWWAR